MAKKITVAAFLLFGAQAAEDVHSFKSGQFNPHVPHVHAVTGKSKSDES